MLCVVWHLQALALFHKITLWYYCCSQIQNIEINWILVWKFFINKQIFLLLLFFSTPLCEGWSEWLPLLMPSWFHRKKLWDGSQWVWKQSMPKWRPLQRPGEWIQLPVFTGLLRSLLWGEGSGDITAILVMDWILERNISPGLNGSNPRLKHYSLT